MLDKNNSKNKVNSWSIQAILLMFISSVSLFASANELTSLQYNTIQKNAIELVFKFSQSIDEPEVNTKV